MISALLCLLASLRAALASFLASRFSARIALRSADVLEKVELGLSGRAGNSIDDSENEFGESSDISAYSLSSLAISLLVMMVLCTMRMNALEDTSTGLSRCGVRLGEICHNQLDLLSLL